MRGIVLAYDANAGRVYSGKRHTSLLSTIPAQFGELPVAARGRHRRREGPGHATRTGDAAGDMSAEAVYMERGEYSPSLYLGFWRQPERLASLLA